MSGLTGGDGLATLVAAIVTLIVLGGLLGERRVFGWTQHLFAGLVAGYVALLAITEVIVPRVLAPLAAAPLARLDAWIGVGLVVVAAAAPWAPRAVSAVPVSITVGALAAFALGGAVVGTLMPQVAATIVGRGGSVGETLSSLASGLITVVVLVGFLHGAPRGRLTAAASRTGRWLMIGGIGGWLGYLLYSRLVLLIDRLAFLVGDWLGLGR